MSAHYITASGRTYPIEAGRIVGDEGELLSLPTSTAAFPWQQIRERPATLWRYAEALPVSPEFAARTTMGEGMTPLVSYGDEHPNLKLKVDYMMPTLSFKDRGAAVLMAKAAELGVERCIADSSGNAGTSIAAYAARLGIKAKIFVAASTSPKKLNQIEQHGAELVKIEGSREDVAAAALRAVQESGDFYASHVYNPFFYEGTKTYAFELFEQLGRVPDAVILPVGNGTLVLGCFRGFSELMRAGSIDRLPRFVLVQAAECGPLARAWQAGASAVETGPFGVTAAEGIAIAAPKRAAEILDVVRATNGTIVTVTEEAIASARADLARRGFFVEITSAVNLAGYAAWLAQDASNQACQTVVPLCGAGLKSG